MAPSSSQRQHVRMLPTKSYRTGPTIPVRQRILSLVWTYAKPVGNPPHRSMQLYWDPRFCVSGLYRQTRDPTHYQNINVRVSGICDTPFDMRCPACYLARLETSPEYALTSTRGKAPSCFQHGFLVIVDHAPWTWTHPSSAPAREFRERRTQLRTL